MNCKMVVFDSSSSCTAYNVRVNGELSDYGELKPKGKTADERINPMMKMICEVLQKHKPQIVYAETPQGKNNIKLSRQLGEIIGCIRGWCAYNDVEFHEENPSWWRKWNYDFQQGGKNRNELKEESIRIVKEKYGMDCSDDLADSINFGDAILNYYDSLSVDF